MSDTITLGDFDTELVFEAAIDGAVAAGAGGRHVPARRYALISRQYRRLRSLVSHNGEDFFRVPGTAAATPARAPGEDWIELPWPTDASEIISVDVQQGGVGGPWRELSRGSWAQRRVFAGARSGVLGEWTTLSMPQPSLATVTAGKIVVWPHSLSGLHRVDYLPKWTALTDPAHVLVMMPDWHEWMLTACTMVLIQRDNDKHGTFGVAKVRNDAATADILRHTRRHLRGSVVARRRDGMEL